MKKMFMSLLIGFGAALGVFVALSMPPGGWGVAVGVGLGLLGCIPLFIVLIMVLNRGQSQPAPRREYDEQPPVIIIQQPAFQPQPAQSPYEMYAGANEAYGYMEAPEYYAQPIEPRYQPRPASRRLQANRRRPQPEYYQEYYEQPEPEYAEYYEEAPQYDTYYDSRQTMPEYDYAEPEEPVRTRPRRPSRPRRALRSQDAVEAEYRMIGDNE